MNDLLDIGPVELDLKNTLTHLDEAGIALVVATRRSPTPGQRIYGSVDIGHKERRVRVGEVSVALIGSGALDARILTWGRDVGRQETISFEFEFTIPLERDVFIGEGPRVVVRERHLGEVASQTMGRVSVELSDELRMFLDEVGFHFVADDTERRCAIVRSASNENALVFYDGVDVVSVARAGALMASWCTFSLLDSRSVERARVMLNADVK